jgi:hypothetical protein
MLNCYVIVGKDYIINMRSYHDLTVRLLGTFIEMHKFWVNALIINIENLVLYKVNKKKAVTRQPFKLLKPN